MPESKRQLAAIMFTDIVGYTKLMGNDEQKALDLVARGMAFQKELVRQYHGVWIKEIGDGAFARFNSALDAVNCSIEIQRKSRADFEGELRIGIHLGDVTIENNDALGDGVNIASRIESITDPGGIYISESVEKAIRGRIEIQTRFLGNLSLKNVSYEVGTYALQGVGLPVPDLASKEKLSGTFSAEIKRRGVLRAGLTYLIISLLLFVLHNQLDVISDLSNWISAMFVAVLVIGFPLSLWLAWKFERSPEGFVLTTSKESWRNPLKASERKPLTGYLSILGLLIIICFLYLYPQSSSNNFNNSELKDNKSIAFLPLQNISDEENDYLANGVKSEIATYLRNIPDLKVYAGLDVEQLLKNNLTKKEIGSKLGVTSTLEGSIWKEKKRFKLNLVLTDLETDEILWNKSYEKEYDLIMDVVSEVAQDLAQSIKIALDPEQQLKITAKPTASPEAYDLNLRAWQVRARSFYSNNRDSVLLVSNNIGRKALEYDPEYVHAYELIAANEVDMGNIDTAAIIMNKMLEKFPYHSITYKLKGGIDFYLGKYATALTNYRKAIELGSSDPWIFMQVGRILCFVEKNYEEGLPYMIKGAELPPNPGMSAIFAWLPNAFWNIGDYEKSLYWTDRYFNYASNCNALTQLVWNFQIQNQHEKSTQILDSLCSQLNCSYCDMGYIMVNLYSGNIAEAVSIYQQGPDVSWNNYFHRFWSGYLKIKAGEAEEGVEILNNLKSEIEINPRIGMGNIDWTHLLAATYAALGSKEKALELLLNWGEYSLLPGELEFMLSNPMYENLLEEPAYIDLCKRMDQEKAEIRARIADLEARGAFRIN